MTAMPVVGAGSGCVPGGVPDDRRFLAASRVAIALVELCGEVPEAAKAKRVSVVTFLLLELLDANEAEGGQAMR